MNKRDKSSRVVMRAMKYIFKVINLEITSEAMERDFELNPEYPSIVSMTEALTQWNIHNLYISVPHDKLDELNFPAITEMERVEEGVISIAVVEAVDHHRVKLYDPSRNMVEWVDKKVFFRKWNGNIVVLEKSEYSGESGFSKNKAKVLKRKYHHIIGYSSIAVIIIAGVLVSLNSLMVFLLFLIKALGLTLSIGLIMQDLKFQSPAIDKICKAGGKKTNCEFVTGSSVGTLFGWLKLSGVGGIYYSGTLLCLMIGTIAFVNAPYLTPLKFFNYFAIPVSLFLVYYQFYKLKVWCPLCMGIQVLLWVEFAVFLSSDIVSSALSLSFELFIVYIVLLSQASAAYFLMVPMLSRSKELKPYKKHLSLVLKNHMLFVAMLKNTTRFAIEPFDNDIIIGPRDATMTITTIINFNCGSCKDALKEIPRIVDIYDDVNFRIRFDFSKVKQLQLQMVRHLMALQVISGEEKAGDALLDWPNMNHDDRAWKAKYSIDVKTFSSEKIDEWMNNYLNWFEQLGFSQSPIYFLNGRLIPPVYSIHHLKYFIRYLQDVSQKKIIV